MAFGSFYDLVFGLSILFAPSTSSALLRIPLPGDMFYLHLNGVFLLLLAALYALPAVRPERFHPIAPIAAAGRVVGFAVFTLAWRGGRPLTFLVLACADLAIGLVTAAAWAKARRHSPSA
jgi:hypothetical protein